MSHSQLDEESRIRKIITLSIAGLLISAVSFSGGMVFAQSSLAKPGSLLEQINVSAGGNNFKTSIKDFDSDLFAEVWKLLQRDYVDHNELDQKKMFYGALHGLVASTGDPYTMFFDPEENKEFKTDVSGKFEGIGAEIGLKDDLITVIAPLEGMPAEKAGVRAGDKIIAIDEASTVGMTVDQAVKKIRGAGGTKVVLSILRDKAKTPIKISIERGVIVIKSVKKTVKDGVNIIRISSFSQDTEAEFNQAVSEVLASKSKDLIIDLRNNPGGYLDVAIAMIGRWIGDEVAVIEKYSQDKQTPHRSSGPANLKNFHTVILVNDGSASAAEILAGALQDYKLGILVGKKTFGKGSVQTLEELSDGSSVKITSAKWLTPKGRSINKEGIMPDIEVLVSEEDIKATRDVQLLKALEVLKKYDQYKKP